MRQGDRDGSRSSCASRVGSTSRSSTATRSCARSSADAAIRTGPVAIEWDGRDDAGRVLPEGELPAPRPRARRAPDDHAAESDPNRRDAAGAPGRQGSPRVVSPDGDGRRDRVTVRYRLNEPGRGALFVNGKRRARHALPAHGGDDRLEREESSGRALDAGDLRAAAGRGRPGRKPDRRGRRRSRSSSATSRSAATASPSPREPASAFASRPTRARALDARRPQRLLAAGHAPASRAAPEGPLHADGLRERAHGARRRVRPGAAALTELARLAGPLGCLGLALLLVATRRELRLAGLVAWAVGAGTLGLYLAPDDRGGMLGVAALGGLVAASAGAWLLLRQPWVLAFATLACIPIRIPFDIGDEEANLLFPLYAVIGALALALALAAAARRRALPRARAARLAARRGRRVDRGRAALDRRPPRGRDLPRRVRAPVRPARGRLRTAAVQPPRAARPLRRAGRDRARVRRRRALPVGDAGGLLEPEAAGRQRLRAVLPRQLGLLGSVDLRALSRRRDPRDAGARPPRRARPAARRRDRRDRRGLDRPALLVLAVELRGADRGNARRRRGDLALARGRGAGGARGRARLGRLRDAAGAPRAAAGVARRAQLGHERPRRSRRQRPPDRRGPPDRRRRHRQLQAGVRGRRPA